MWRFNLISQWRHQKFSFGIYSPGVLGMEVPHGVQWRSHGRMSGGESGSSLQTLFTDFDCRNDQNLKISHNSLPDPWPVCFSVGVGAKLLFEGFPSPCLALTLIRVLCLTVRYDITIALHFHAWHIKFVTLFWCYWRDLPCLVNLLGLFHTQRLIKVTKILLSEQFIIWICCHGDTAWCFQ